MNSIWMHIFTFNLHNVFNFLFWNCFRTNTILFLIRADETTTAVLNRVLFIRTDFYCVFTIFKLENHESTRPVGVIHSKTIVIPSDQKENKSRVLTHFLFYRKVCLCLRHSTHNYACYAQPFYWLSTFPKIY
jgi:hypothetical protein